MLSKRNRALGGPSVSTHHMNEVYDKLKLLLSDILNQPRYASIRLTQARQDRGRTSLIRPLRLILPRSLIGAILGPKVNRVHRYKMLIPGD